MADVVTFELSNGAVASVEVAPPAMGIDRVPSIDFDKVKQVIEGIWY
jgi:hypothetical protein